MQQNSPQRQLSRASLDSRQLSFQLHRVAQAPGSLPWITEVSEEAGRIMNNVRNTAEVRLLLLALLWFPILQIKTLTHLPLNPLPCLCMGLALFIDANLHSRGNSGAGAA